MNLCIRKGFAQVSRHTESISYGQDPHRTGSFYGSAHVESFRGLSRFVVFELFYDFTFIDLIDKTPCIFAHNHLSYGVHRRGGFRRVNREGRCIHQSFYEMIFVTWSKRGRSSAFHIVECKPKVFVTIMITVTP